MDVNRRIGVKDALLALLLAVLQGCPLGEPAPNPSPLVGSNWGNPRRYIHLQTSTDMSNFYLEIRLDGTVRKSTARTSYSEKSSTLLWEKSLWRHRDILIVSCSSRRCDFTESRNERAHRHPGRQEQPLPVYGSWGETIQLCKCFVFVFFKLRNQITSVVFSH